MTWLETYTGVAFNLKNPSADDVNIEDIARSLSRMPRYFGHSSEFYSVAQHSLMVEQLVAARDVGPMGRLAALLHDAAEAYMGDMVHPLKEMIPGYRRIYARVERAVEDALLRGMSPDRMGVAHHIKQADKVALATEARDLMPSGGKGWDPIIGVEPCEGKIIPWKEGKAWSLFLQRYDHLVKLEGQRRLEVSA